MNYSVTSLIVSLVLLIWGALFPNSLNHIGSANLTAIIDDILGLVGLIGTSLHINWINQLNIQVNAQLRTDKKI